MKKIALVLPLVMLLILTGGVIAETALSEEIQQFVKEIQKSKEINESEITSVKQVDFNEEKEQIKFENIDDTNLALYELEIKGKDKPIYMITISDQQLRKTIEKYTNRMLLSFGKKDLQESSFMETATGIMSSEEKGYVMIRDGSVTGISTNIEIIEGQGEIEIILYKNGKPTGFKNQFNEKGIQSDYDLQSEGIIEFQKGDIISLRVNNKDFINIKDINSLLEVMTE
jgi:uncharacterized protein YxeA